jgi:hypothetical protein
MSDTSQGHGWWLASDGKWYPPEAWTGPPPQMSQPPFQPQSGPTPYPTGQPPYAYGAPMPQFPPTAWVQPRPTNGLAVASLVCSCVGVVPFLFGVPCILGIIFGFVSRGRIRRSNGMLSGEGLALAGIIVGFSLIGLFIIAVIVAAIFGHFANCGTGGSLRVNCSSN